MAYEFAPNDRRFQRSLALAASPPAKADPWLKGADDLYDQVRYHWDDMPAEQRAALHAGMLGLSPDPRPTRKLRELGFAIRTWLDFTFRRAQTIERFRKLILIAEAVHDRIGDRVWDAVLADPAAVAEAERGRAELDSGDEVELLRA